MTTIIKDLVIEDLSVIKQQMNLNNVLMSLDVSKKHLGVAISDSNLLIAFEQNTLLRNKLSNDILNIQKIIQQKNVFAIVIGLPLDNEGNLNERTQSIFSFIKSIKNTILLPIFVQDERFSTYFSNHKLQENKHLNNSIKRKNIDSYAASWFLQNFLDKFNNYNNRGQNVN